VPPAEIQCKGEAAGLGRRYVVALDAA